MAPPPAACGQRFLPTILDDLASSDPDRIIYSIAKSADVSQGFRQVSAREFVDAVSKLAWWLVDQLGEPTTHGAVLGYIGPRTFFPFRRLLPNATSQTSAE